MCQFNNAFFIKLQNNHTQGLVDFLSIINIMDLQNIDLFYVSKVCPAFHGQNLQ
jgi:hypothetical protein